MRCLSLQSLMTGALTASLCCFIGSLAMSAEKPTEKKPVAEKTEKSPDKAKPKADKPRERKAKTKLPALYEQVINDKQRAQIASIDEKHEPGLTKLRSALKDAQQKRNAEITALLTPEQEKKVAELRAEAKAKRKSGKVKSVSSNKSVEKKSAASVDEKPTKKKRAKPKAGDDEMEDL